MKFKLRYLYLFMFVMVIGVTNAQNKEVKNVILMIPDGTSTGVLSISRWYQQANLLAVDPYICGLVKTHSSDAPIGDSAPTGSTYATGHLSKTQFIATYPDYSVHNLEPMDKFEAFQPLFTILEASKLQKKATGLVATSYFPHATPAAFAAHHPSRSEYEILSKQMVFNNVDVVIAGGSYFLNQRKDKIDLTKVLMANNISYTENLNEFRAFKGLKMWALFSEWSMANDIDRDVDKEPSLAEMTEKAIEILSQNKNGFFLMVEGSKVDWSAHDNDPIGVITEYLAFDKAVAKAIDFAKKDGSTAVVVLPDHGNGGISLGNSQTNKGYDKKTYSELFDNLRKATKTAEHFGTKYKTCPTEEQIKEYFSENFGINNLIIDEINSISAFFQYEKLAKKGKNKKNPTEINKIIANIINNRNPIGWTTTGHTGEDVFLAIYHPHQYRPTGLVQNTDINRYMCEIMNTPSLDSLTSLYYAPATKVFEKYIVSIDSSNVYEPFMMIQSEKAELRIPANKNEVWFTLKPNKNRQIIPLQTLVIYNGHDFYIPLYLEELLR
ncbi:MAG: alkaline phosphatase [Bacteroidales bacterium]|nr:alkaline phosphatase [Bacteroidales bacterium]MDY0215479.1 alkaline phosphatase [Bacteroidales bacterium]